MDGCMERRIYVKIGYARYISDNQSSDNVVKIMEKAKVDKLIFGISSQSNDQKKFKEFIHTLEKEDILVVKGLETLGETIIDIIDILNLLNEKEIGIQVLEINSNTDEDVELKNVRFQKILKRYLIHVLELASDNLKEDIRYRQSIGAKYAKRVNTKKKKTKGRPKKYSENAKDPYDREIYYAVVAMLDKNIPISDIADELYLSRTTVYRIKEDIEKDDHTE